MSEALDLDWVSFNVGPGQSLTVDINWGDGTARAGGAATTSSEAGPMEQISLSDLDQWSTVPPTLDDATLWLASAQDDTLAGTFEWSVVSGQASLDESVFPDPYAVSDGVRDLDIEIDESIFTGADIVLGREIPLGDVLIGRGGEAAYRITGELEGDTVTILDHARPEPAPVLDISDLLSTGAETMDVVYDSHSLTSILTVSGSGGESTVIVVQGADLTADFDAQVITGVTIL